LPSSTLASRSLGRTLASRQTEPKLSFFLSGLPLWAAMSLLVVLPTIAAMCGLILIRRRVGLE
jgi:hypothetical protein